MGPYTLAQYRASEIQEINYDGKSTTFDLQLESGERKTVDLSDIVMAATGNFNRGFRVAIEINPGVRCALQFGDGRIKYRFGAPARLEKLVASSKNRRYSLIVVPQEREEDEQRGLPLAQWTGPNREGFFSDGS